MVVNKSSWHYRVWSFAYPRGAPSATNLCRYFWRVVFGLWLMLCCTFVAVFAVCAISWFTWAGVIFFFVERNWGWYALAYTGVFAVIVLLSHMLDYNVLQLRRKKRGPGLVRSYIRAKKQKICPIVEFK